MRGSGYYLIRAKPNSVNNEYALGAPLAHVSYDDLRIAHGYPRFPNEISEDYIPLETGLTDAISFSKGCYVGQEIIARMDSRGQIAKRLVKLDAPSGEFVEGDEVLASDQPVGKVTSAQTDHFDGHRYALGYVRTPFAVAGKTLDIGPHHAAGTIVETIGMR
jgi:aminomethyltransferase